MMRLILPLVVVFAALSLPTQAQNALSDTPTYVGSEQCTDCHKDEAAAWAGSHHALAWTMPSPDTVVADFNDTEFLHDGVLTRFRTDGGTFHISITEQDGTSKEYAVHSVAGIEPLQQYLLETEPGRLQSFDVAWDTERQRWFHLYADQNLPPEDGLHWTGPYKNWNGRCAECHATGFKKNFDFPTQSYASTQAEMGVTCEACHGPAARHVEWAENVESGAVVEALQGYGFDLDFAAVGTEATIQQCAGCHSRREPQSDGNPLPGTPYHDAYKLALLRPGLYHADGQILDEVYVFGSFLQSKMYAKGVGCLNCHDAHSADLKAEGNAVCTQCHSPAGNSEFPSLTEKLYDSTEHHFHEDGSEGAQCKSCHMIERVYMGVDGRRDHSFRIPRPDLFGQTGGPDACTDCHQNQTPDWAAAEIAKRYPDNTNRGLSYGLVLAKGRVDPIAARDELVRLAESPNEAALVRATALWLLEQVSDPAVANRLAPLLEDADPVIRAAAIGLQSAASPQDRVGRFVARLEDPVRTVRSQAAKAMLGQPIARLPDKMAQSLRNAMNEWHASLSSRIDYPESHLVLGGIALTTRNLPAATGAFREAVRLDPQQIQAWIILARIAAATEGTQAAESVIAEALSVNPTSQQLQELLDGISDQ